MSMKKKSTETNKKRVQHQLYLARESPEPIFDLSNCELIEIPSGVFSLCKVLQKESLILQNNKLHSFKGGGTLNDLSILVKLDISKNFFINLPSDLAQLENLKNLDISNNQLSSLPISLTTLTSLKKLNLSRNKFSVFPEIITHMKSLIFLDISFNNINYLPISLSDNCSTLSSLIIDVQFMLYPTISICQKGIEEIMKFLCQEARVEYIAPPSIFPLNGANEVFRINENKTTSSQFGFMPSSTSCNNIDFENSIMEYERMKAKKSQIHLESEKLIDEQQRLQASLVAENSANKQHLLQYLSQEHKKMRQDLVNLNNQKSKEREKLIKILYEVESKSQKFIKKFCEINEKAKKSEALLEEMEKERIKQEKWYVVRQEELQNIRKKDILRSFENMLENEDAMGMLIKNYIQIQQETNKKTIKDCEIFNYQVDNSFNLQSLEKQEFLQRMLKEEKLQKQAFEMLQFDRDASHQRIMSQIQIIEQQLLDLTLLEIEQKALMINVQINVLEENRSEFTKLLKKLFEEKEKREKELHLRLLEMENQKLENQVDYWLVQYQRLLDFKPNILEYQENQLDKNVLQILQEAGASNYIPQFARHNISIGTLIKMTSEDFKYMGINDNLLNKLRKAIETFKLGELSITVDSAVKPFLLPSAPEIGNFKEKDELDAKEALNKPIIARATENECVICLSEKPSILFLNCGHICTCKKCSAHLTICPLDRSEIVQKITLDRNLFSF